MDNYVNFKVKIPQKYNENKTYDRLITGSENFKKTY